jgi:thiamine phosphate synthase YjbQ (UPF0047 family)
MEADKQAENAAKQVPPAVPGKTAGKKQIPVKKGEKKLGAWDEFRLMMADFFGQAHQS